MSTNQERRIRTKAKALGLMLVKHRGRDRLAENYGTYVLVDDCRGNRVGRYGGQAAASEFASYGGRTLDQLATELDIIAG